MSVSINVYVEDIATTIASYDTIRLYSSQTADGTFTLVTTGSLAADTEEYTLTDATGDSSYYYRYTFFNSSTLAESGYSYTTYATGTELVRLRYEAAVNAGAGSSGTCSANGGSLTLVDELLLDTGIDVDYLEGAWIYRPDATTSTDRLRRVASNGFATDTGTLTVTRSYATAPASGEAYQIFKLLPPVDHPGEAYSWTRAVREGLNCIWYTDQLNLGEGTTDAERRFDLSPFLPYVQRNSIKRVLLRTTDANDVITDVDASKNLRYWEYVSNGPQDLKIEVSPAPLTNETVIVEVNRKYEPLYNDTDVTMCPFELAWRATLYAAYRYLNRVQSGRYTAELADSLGELRKELPQHKPAHGLIGV